MRKFSEKKDYLNYVYRLKEIIGKDELIVDLCQGKEVLDIGCIDHSYKTALALGNKWLHKRIKDVSTSLVGLDMLEEDARILNEKGYNIVIANAENFELDKKFDVVVAGDLIEHLSNIGNFLDAAQKHLKPEGLLIITTPNPFNVEQFFMILFENHIMVNNQHTVWIDPRVMWETATRHNYKIDNFHWIETRFVMPLYRKYYKTIFNPIGRYLMKKRPLLNRDYCVILKIDSNSE